MKTAFFGLLALSLLPLSALADAAKLPWDASAQSPTTFAVPAGQEAAVMAHAVSLLNGWKAMDPGMWPMPLRTQTIGLIESDDPTALGLFGVKITDAPTQGVAVITVETTAYEGKAFLISQQHRNASKRAHLLAYYLEQAAGVSTSETTLPSAPLPTPVSTPSPSPNLATPFGPSLDKLQQQLNSGQYENALATLDALRGEIVRRQTQGK